MHIDFQKVIDFKSKIRIDHLCNSVVLIIVIAILMLACTAVNHPITVLQFGNIIKISKQAKYPKSQHMAIILSAQQQVTYAEYLRLMNAFQLEQQKANELPPLSDDSFK